MKRPIAEALRRLGLLRLAFRSYESLLATDWASLLHSRTGELGPDSLPIPPKRLRVIAGPAAADLSFFLKTGVDDAQMIEDALCSDATAIETVGAILDFGCGCGRVMRRWKRLQTVQRHGCDLRSDQLAWCKQNLPFAQFDQNRLDPPLPYEDGDPGV